MGMANNETGEANNTVRSPEGSELNGEKASFRNAPMRSEGVVLPRMRLPNGATVPLPRKRV